MKKLASMFKEKVVKPIDDTIRPHAIRYYKNSRPRDANAYHYRYPSPGSYEINREADDRWLDHRIPFKDSIHDIKYYKHVSAKDEPDEYFATNGLTSDLEAQLQSNITSNKKISCDQSHISARC